MFLHLSVILFTWGCLCLGVSLSGGVSVQGGLCRGGVSVHGGSLSRGSLSVGPLSGGISVRETPRTVTCGRYASYWNAFLFTNKFCCNEEALS